MQDYVLTCRQVIYRSRFDKQIFFKWIERIDSIRRWEAFHDTRYLYVTVPIPDDDLKEIIGLFYRCNIEMKQLSVFLNEHYNQDWFCNENMYWYSSVFTHAPKREECQGGAFRLQYPCQEIPNPRNNDAQLEFAPVLYSSIDKTLLFEWISYITSIHAWYISGESIYLHVDMLITDYDLLELLALLYRYNLNMKQMCVFLREDNRHWFYDLGVGFWHQYVFDTHE